MAFDFPDSSSLPDGYRVTNPETFSEYSWQSNPGKWVLVDPQPMSDLFVSKTGDIMSGPLFLTDDPVLGDPGVIGTDPAQAVHKKYVDDAVAGGGSGSLPLDLDTTGMGQDAEALRFAVENGQHSKVVIEHGGSNSAGIDLVFDPPHSPYGNLRMIGGPHDEVMFELMSDGTVRFKVPVRNTEQSGQPKIPQHDDDLTTKQYVDQEITAAVGYDGSDKLSLDGSTPMTGNLDLGNQSLVNAATLKTLNGGTIVENTSTRLIFDGNVQVKSAGHDRPGFNVEGYMIDEDKFWAGNGSSYKTGPLIQVGHHSSSKVDDIYLRGHVLIHQGLNVATPYGVSGPLEVYAWKAQNLDYYRPPLSERLLHVNPGNDSILTSQIYVNNFSSANERSLAPKQYVDTTRSAIVTSLRNAVANSTTFAELKLQLIEALDALAD